jgi:hypothetical protein
MASPALTLGAAPPQAARALRWRAAVALVAAVLGLHLALLAWPRAPAKGRPATGSFAVMQVRTLQTDAVAGSATAQPPLPPAAAPAATPNPRSTRVTADPDVAAAAHVQAPATGAPTVTASGAAQAATQTEDESDAGAETAETLASLHTQPLPIYAMQAPPPVQLRYRMRRGGREGEALLDWAPAPDGGYRLRFEREWAGGQALASLSQGALSSQGLAPERFLDRRRQRDVAAANFERAARRIRFSGPQIEYPLWPGVQDRASWLIQLAGIVHATAALREAGAEVALVVVGSRGDASLWRFRVQGLVAVPTTGAQTDAATTSAPAPLLHLQRAPRRPYDTQVDVWLDPQRHHLPVRVQWLALPSGALTDMWLLP